MANPLYGQNKADSSIDAMSQYKKTVICFDIYVDSDSPDDDASTGVEIPGQAIVTHCSISNIGATALSSGAKTLDLNGINLTASAASLAVGASVGSSGSVPIYIAAAANILVDGNIYVGSSNTTLRVLVEYYEPHLDSDAISLKFSGGAD